MRIPGNSRDSRFGQCYITIMQTFTLLQAPRIQRCLNTGHLLAFQAIERLVQNIIIPFIGSQLIVMVEDGEGIDQGGTDEGVHILWQKLALTRSVLGPVGEIAYHLMVGSCCVGSKGILTKAMIPMIQYKCKDKLNYAIWYDPNSITTYPAGRAPGIILRNMKKYG